MELRLLFLFFFYLICCTNSVSIYNDELSEDEYVSRMARFPRSPNVWNLEEETKFPRQKRDLSEEQQEGLRHENLIYISLAGNSEKSKESSDEKRESSSLWSILGKTTAFLTPPIIKALLPRTLAGDIDFSARSNFNPPPFYPAAAENRLWNDEPLLTPALHLDRRFIPI